MSLTISILGSINLDTTYHITRIPLVGETIHINEKTLAPGGKGANQAIAAKRSGAMVNFIGAVGADEAGTNILNKMQKDGINTKNIKIKNNIGTGTATILLDSNGQNSILVYPGANNEIDTKQIENAEDTIVQSDFLISQFEIPSKSILQAFKLAKKNNVTTLLNPAPAMHISDELLKVTDIIVPNETENKVITGIELHNEDDMKKSAKYFRERGVNTTIITLGSKGVYCSTLSINKIISAYKVNVIDTTGAGDTFIGAMASTLNPNLSNILDAIDYGQKASSLTVQKMGAQPSIPTKEKIEQNYERK